VTKEDFDFALKSAQEALRAKTASSQMMLQQASSAMRNAVTALSLSEQEVANLRDVVKELKENQANGVGGEAGDRELQRERAQLRAAQARVAELSQNFRNLQSEVARMQYEQTGVDMPVATKFPVRIDPMLSSKVVCIAQIVMLGYAYADAEDAIDAVRVNDAQLAVEWLEARNVVKIDMLADVWSAAGERRSTRRLQETQTSARASPQEQTNKPLYESVPMIMAHESVRKITAAAETFEASASPEERRFAPKEKEPSPERAFAPGTLTRRGFDANEMYAARKRAVMAIAVAAVQPPDSLAPGQQDDMSLRALRALARLSLGNGAYMAMLLGAARCAAECLKMFPGDSDVARAACDIVRGLATNPSTMIKFKKQKRFALLPRAIARAVEQCDGEASTAVITDVRGDAAWALWAMATLGGAETQDRIVQVGAVDFIRSALSRPKSDDPDGVNTKKLLGCLLALATRNARLQEIFVQTGTRALIRKGLVEHADISFKGEFSSLREWTKAEFANPTPLPDGVVIDTGAATARVNEATTRAARREVHSATKREEASTQHAVTSKTTVTTTVTEEEQETTREEARRTLVQSAAKKMSEMSETTGAKEAWRRLPGATAEKMYAAKKRAIKMLSAVAVNPPGKFEGISPEQSEDTARRCLLALARLSLGDAAYLVHTSGGPRAAIDCLRLYPSNAEITVASYGVIRGLLQNPATMMKFRKQKRFRIVPATVVDGVHRHDRFLDVKAEAAHTLWTYAGVGGADAQRLVLAVEFLDVIRSGLEEARREDKGRTDKRVRKFVGCLLALAKGNAEIQDELVREGARSLIRKSLVEFGTISFHGEFAELRDWIRGDRGGAKSVTRRGPPPAAEKNAAETTLAKGIERSEDGRSLTHAEAAKVEEAEVKKEESDRESGKESDAGGRRIRVVEASRRATESDVKTATAGATTTTTATTHRVVTSSSKTSSSAARQHFSTHEKTTQETFEERSAFDGVDRLHRIADEAKPPDGAGLRAKRATRFVPDESGAEGSEPYTVERAIKTLNSDRRERHGEACEALAEMFAAAPAVGVEIVMKGGVGAVTNAIAAGNAASAAGGLALLHMFASADVTTRRVKADEGVVTGRCPAAILGVMRRYHRNTAVQQWGAMTLWALARDNPRMKRAVAEAKIPGGRGTASEIIANALKNHATQSEGVAKALAGCVLAFATNDVAWQEAWLEVDAPGLVMRALEAHERLTFKGEFDALRDWLREHA
jgi:hypothetical protein